MSFDLFGYRLLSPQSRRELEARAEAKWRQVYEGRRASEEAAVERLRRETELLRASAERECEQMKTECRRSIRRQYEQFDREWQAREDKTRDRVRELEAEVARLTHALRGHNEKSGKLLALAVDRRTPEPEAIAAFLKAREQGIRLHRE